MRAALMGFGVLTISAAHAQVPPDYHQVWADEFTTLSLRTGGPTDRGLEQGTGIWSAPGAWYSSDPRGVAGNGGWDWYTDPSYYGWPHNYHGQFVVVADGLRIRAEPSPSAAWQGVLPLVTGKGWGGSDDGQHSGVAPWLAGQINSYHGVRIKPPFYFEAKAKFPAGHGRPFPAIWLNTEARHSNEDSGRNYEIDVQEGFGDSNRLHAGIHWDAGHNQYPMRKAVDKALSIDLSADFHTWGCWVTSARQVFYFDGAEVGQVDTPDHANIDQPFGIMLDISAGLPWKNGGPPSDGPHDLIIRYVRLYAPTTDGLTLNDHQRH